jgi:VanZ family protein
MQLNLLLTRLYNLFESNKKRYVYYPLLIYWLILLGLTSYPTDAFPSFGIGDKFEHLIAYLVLSIFLYLAFHFQNKYNKLKENPALYTILISCFYGIIDELHQYYIPGRYFDLLDLASNFIGVLLAVSVVAFFVKSVSQLKDSKS